MDVIGHHHVAENKNSARSFRGKDFNDNVALRWSKGSNIFTEIRSDEENAVAVGDAA